MSASPLTLTNGLVTRREADGDLRVGTHQRRRARRAGWRRGRGRHRIGGGAAPGVGVALQPCQVRPQLGGVLVAQVAVFLQRFGEDLFDLGGQIGIDAQRRRRRTVEDRVEYHAGGCA